MSSCQFTTNDSLSTTTLPTLTGAWWCGGWVKNNSYGQSGEPCVFGMGTTGGSSYGFLLYKGIPILGNNTSLGAVVFTGGGGTIDSDPIMTGSDTAWLAWIAQYSGSGTVYTVRYRKETITSWSSVSIDCGAQLSGGSPSMVIGADQFGDFDADCQLRSFACQSGTTISDADALTFTQNLNSAPAGTNLHWLDLDSATNAEVNGGSGGNWTVTGTIGTAGNEPSEGGGGGGGGRRLLLGVGRNRLRRDEWQQRNGGRLYTRPDCIRRAA